MRLPHTDSNKDTAHLLLPLEPEVQSREVLMNVTKNLATHD